MTKITLNQKQRNSLKASKLRLLSTGMVLLCAWQIFAAPLQTVFAAGGCNDQPSEPGGISECQIQAYKEGAGRFEVTAGGQNCIVNVSAALNGNDNQEIAYRYFLGKQVGDNTIQSYQSAGIVGNLMQESGVDPTAKNKNGAYGIAQWLGGRYINLAKDATAAGVDIHQAGRANLGFQLDFLWKELQAGEGGALKALMKSTNPAEAATSFEATFERSGGSGLANRIKNATDVFNKYAGSPAAQSGQGDGSNIIPASSDGSCNTTGTGEDTQFADGFTFYSQYDKAWENTSYGDSTIGDSGCGPTSMAMIITTLTGKAVTPPETAKFAEDNGQYAGGSKWSIAPVLAEHWGLKAEALGGDMSRINIALRSGGLVIVAGTGSLPFTSKGHFVVIRGLTSDGKWLIGDPAHKDSNTKAWDPQQILNIVVSSKHAGSVYAITKDSGVAI